MKKTTCKFIALLLITVMALAALPGCSGNPSKATPTPAAGNTPIPTTDPTQDPAGFGTDWSAFKGWMEEDWDGKDISYQFTGEWSMDGEYAMLYHILINLYSDGSLLAEQYGSHSYTYYGYWSESHTEDGNEIAINTLCENPAEEGGEYVGHEYDYVLYEESDGGYSFGFTINLAPGQYFRTADVTGSAKVTYASLADFRTAADAAAAQDAQSGDSGEGPAAGSYASHTMVLPFTPDTSEQLKTEFYCDAAAWGTALGAGGSYEPTDSTDVILSWVSDGSENYHLDFKADGTFEYQFTTAGVTETGVWSFTGWTLSAATANGNTFTASITD